jgi:hypothetical protein
VARDGTVGVRFYDLRRDRLGDAPLTTDSWFRHSHDRGRHWREARLGRSPSRGSPRSASTACIAVGSSAFASNSAGSTSRADFQFVPEELVDLGDRRVLVSGRIVGSGISSGAGFDTY